MDLSPHSLFDLESFAHKDLFNGCTYAWEVLSKIKTYLKEIKIFSIEVEIPSGVHLINPETISIGKGTVVEPGAYIRGPCIIGQDCEIRHGAYIRGGVITGNKCVIGHDTEIKNSILLNDAKAAHFAYLGDSILGNAVNLGAGTKCANLRLDHKTLAIRVNKQKVQTGLKKIGAIIGDRTQIGCNSVTNPGTIIGKDAFCYPCTNFGGVIPSNSTVKPSTRIIVTGHDSI